MAPQTLELITIVAQTLGQHDDPNTAWADMTEAQRAYYCEKAAQVVRESAHAVLPTIRAAQDTNS